MLYHPELQIRDFEILEPLVYSYRIITARTVSRVFRISVHTARRRLNRLTDGRLLSRLTVWASDIPAIETPLFQWCPGEPEPNHGALAYAAQRRWDSRPVKKRTIYTASDKLLAMYALPPRSHLKLHQATHDLGLTEVFYYCKNRWPHLQFVGEEIFSPARGHGEGVEDAQLLDGDSISAVVEHAGSYRKDRIIHFHQHVVERGLRYFLF